MAKTIGPYRELVTPEGHTVPWYIAPFDERGRCKAPLTRAHLLSALRSGTYTHVYLFSHGWNNDWKAASQRYSSFFDGFGAMRKEHSLAMPDGYRPLLVGVFWPSTALVLPWERAPRFAGGDAADAAAQDLFATDEDASMTDIARSLREESVPRFYELASKDLLDPDEVRELAELVAPTLGDDDELDGTRGATAADLAEAWLAGGALSRTTGSDEDEDDETFGTAAPVVGAPRAAGIFSKLDPRHALRMATVWRMKDRAGTVGAQGVGSLLCDALEATADVGTSFHLVGHSYGAKVMLSSLAHPDALPRPVSSLLLLQPAVSGRCFATDADGQGHPGGYHGVFDRVRLPILTTFSHHDFPLHKTFHLAVRRRSDLGEQRIAAGEPSPFAALGGYGPSRSGADAGTTRFLPIRVVGSPYDELDEDGLELIALDGSRTIDGHGSIDNPSIWWALYEQVRRSPR